MKKLIIALLMLLNFNIYSIYGQQNDPKATEILNGLSTKYKTYSSVRSVFIIKIENPQGKITDTQNGTLYVKGSKYKIELANQDIICNNVTVWTYLKDANEVQINEYTPDDNSINPSEIFTIYEMNFLYALIEEKTIAGKVVQVIDLTPNDKTKNYFKVRLTIDKADKSIMSAKIFDKSGSKITYEVQKLTPNFPLTDAFFSFDTKKYPGIEVVDLR